jgi:hypothetical protein
MITPIRRLIQGKGIPVLLYRVSDGQEFDTIDEAIDCENSLTAQRPDRKTPVYEQIWTIQEAINKAVAENRAVRFICAKSSKEILKEVVDLKDCKLLRPERGAIEMAVVPPTITDFDFYEVDTKLKVSNAS